MTVYLRAKDGYLLALRLVWQCRYPLGTAFRFTISTDVLGSKQTSRAVGLNFRSCPVIRELPHHPALTYVRHCQRPIDNRLAKPNSR